MIKTYQIQQVDKATTTSGKPMVKVLTSEGQINSFDQKVIDAIGFWRDKSVALDVEQQGKYTNVISIVGSGQESVVPQTNSKEKLIIRQSCLKAAVEHCSFNVGKEVLSVAEDFENWVNR